MLPLAIAKTRKIEQSKSRTRQQLLWSNVFSNCVWKPGTDTNC